MSIVVIAGILALIVGSLINQPIEGSSAEESAPNGDIKGESKSKYYEPLNGVVSFSPVKDSSGNLACIVPLAAPSEEIGYLKFTVSKAPVIGDMVVRPALMAISPEQEFSASFSTIIVWLSPCDPISGRSNYQLITGKPRPGKILVERNYVANHRTTEFTVSLLEVDEELFSTKVEGNTVLKERPKTLFPITRGYIDKVAKVGESPIRMFENGLNLGVH